MALLSFEGFEDIGDAGTNPSDDIVTRRYFGTAEPEDFYIVSGRFGDRALRFADSFASITLYAGPDPDTISTELTKIWGISFYCPEFLGWSSNYFCRFVSETNSFGPGIKIHRNGTVVLYDRNGSVLGISAQGICMPQQWHNVEMKIYYHSSSGSAEIRVDGETVINETGIDTTSSSGNYHRRVRIYGFTGVASWAPRFDDIYCLDTTGNTNNDFIGPCRSFIDFPAGDSTSEWTPSTGNTLYNLIDENPPNQVGYDYIAEDTSGNVASFNTGSLPSKTNAIAGVKLGFDATLNDSGNLSLKQLIESNGTEYTGDSHTINTTNWVFGNDYWETDPDTGNTWTKNGYETAKFGLEVQ